MSHDNKKIEAEAREWAMALTDEDIDGEKLQAFQRWRSADPRHQAAFQEADRVWRGIASLIHLHKYAVLPEKAPSLMTRLKEWWSAGSGQWTVAGGSFATIALVAVLVFPMHSDFETYSTSVAEVRSFELEDGTQVTLGGKSKINVQYLAKMRRIELIEGDALFEVTPNPAQPFIVFTGHIETRVLGTVFAVERDPNHVTIAVKEGKVRVGTPQDETAPSTVNSSSAVLTPGQGVVARYDGEVGDVTAVDMNNIGSWIEGRIRYENATLRAIVADANRHHSKEIQIKDDATAALRVSISFNTDNIEQLIENLAKILDLEIKRNLMGNIVLQKR